MAKRELFLHEELMLLALKDRKGTLQSNTMYTYAVGGAVLGELLMAGRVQLDTAGKKDRVQVMDTAPMGDPLLDEWLEAMAQREKPRTPQDWVQRMAQSKDLKHRVARELCRKGILRTDEDKILGIFTRTIYPEVDPGPERDIDARVEKAIVRETEDVAPRTAVLIALAHRAGLLKGVLDKARLKKHKDRIEGIAKGDVTVEATKGAMEAMQAAMVAATTVTTVVTTAAITN